MATTTETTAAPETPELDKQRDVIDSGDAGQIQDFLDWLLERFALAHRSQEEAHVGRGCKYPSHVDPQQLMADYFGINLVEIEKERRALLAHIAGKAGL